MCGGFVEVDLGGPVSNRGFYGIGIFGTKNELNVGTLWRTANLLGASWIFTIGRRYKAQSSDTMKTPRHVPLYEYLTFDDFKAHLPKDTRITAVELDASAEDLVSHEHLERTVYLLGAEDHGIPPEILKKCHKIVRLPGRRSMNVSVAGSIVLYDRLAKERP